MKKEYVAPVMECEEFVANEYVAACYLITCKGYSGILGTGHKAHGSVVKVLDKDPTFDYFDRDGDGFVLYVSPPYGDSYSGEIDGESGPHPVTVTKKGNGNGPNASN